MIVFPPEDYVITVDQFQPAIFVCVAAGIPAPVISWTREQDGQNTTLEASNNTISIQTPVQTENFVLKDVMGGVLGVNRSLTLNKAFDGDSGRYFCVANTSAGIVSREFQLVVQGWLFLANCN